MPRPAKLLPIAISGLLTAQLAYAGDCQTAAEEGDLPCIIGVNLKKVSLYDSELNEVSQKKKKEFKKFFTEVTNDQGVTKQGMKIEDMQDLQGVSMLQVKIPDEGTVWIEQGVVDLWPAQRIDCPDGIVAQSEDKTSGVSVGFGDSCKGR